MIAKLINGYPVPCPKHGEDVSGRYHTNLPKYYETHLDEAAEDVYYPVVYTEKPIGNYIESWEMQTVEGVMSIVQIWTEYTPQPEPMPVPDPYQMRADIDYIAMMGDYDIGG